MNTDTDPRRKYIRRLADAWKPAPPDNNNGNNSGREDDGGEAALLDGRTYLHLSTDR